MTEPEHLMWVALSAALFNNIVLVNMLGLCPFVGIRKLDLVAGIGTATIAVLMFAAGLSHLIEHYLLPADWSFVRPLLLITTIAFLVHLVEQSLGRWSPVLHRRLGVYLPLIVTNCAVLGTALLALKHSEGFLESIVYGGAGGVGFFAAAVLLGCMCDSFDEKRVPKALRGAPITVITAGIMSMSVQGLTGMGN